MRILKCFSSFLLALFFFCSSGEIAGTKGGSETTNGVTACIVNTDGTPAAGSIVRLRLAEYISSQLSEPKSLLSTDIFTDSKGTFAFKNIKPGNYFIEVQNAKKSVLLTFSIDSTDTLDLGTDSLRPDATLNGILDTIGTGNKHLFAQIRGLERRTKVDYDGSFVFNDLPEGNFDLVISQTESTDPFKEVFNINLMPDDTIDVTISGSSTYSAYININTVLSDIDASGILTDFPLLIRLDSTTFDFERAHPKGDDIHFVKTDNTSLPNEIEQWDPISQTAAVWVKIDTIHAKEANQFIIMKWGEADVLNKSNSASVFDTAAGFAGVWHLNEDPSAGKGSIKDRTANTCNGTPSSSMTSANIVSGISGTGLSFNGVSDSIEAGILNLSGNYSLSCWINAVKSPCVNWRFIIRELAYTLWYDTDSGGVRAEHFSDSYKWRGFRQDTPDSLYHLLSLNTWYYLVSTYDGDKIRLYINGEVVDSTLSIRQSPLFGDSNLLLIGGRNNEFFKGVMDEVRIENKARSAQWIKLSYLNQLPNREIAGLKKY